MGRKGRAHVAVDGIKRYQSKGAWYCYDRTTGIRVRAPFGTPEFFAELEHLRAGAKLARLPQGSLGDVIARYKEFGSWASLKTKTRTSYDRVFAILDPLRAVRLSDMTRPQILKLRDQEYAPKYGRWMANYIVTVLGLIFGFAFDQGAVSTNPLEKRVKRIRKDSSAPVANRPWLPDECRIVIERAPMQLRMPIALAMFSGLRKSDILALEVKDIESGSITVRTSKRGVPVRIPMHASLHEIIGIRLELETQDPHVCLTSRGTPWTETGFNASWNKFKNSLEARGEIAPGLTIHGLRHTLGTRLREAGADDRTIADILGQRSLSQARHYSESAGLPDGARAYVLGLEITKKRS